MPRRRAQRRLAAASGRPLQHDRELHVASPGLLDRVRDLTEPSRVQSAIVTVFCINAVMQRTATGSGGGRVTAAGTYDAGKNVIVGSNQTRHTA